MAVNIEQIEKLIPKKAEGYVPFGNFDDVKEIMRSDIFYPTFVSGLSGNGKTEMIKQAAAATNKELIRVNITTDTDEDELLGGMRLKDGNTVWHDGPVVVAMERGAKLLLDECDLGSTKIMCLQPVLEGSPIYLKSVNKIVIPKKGFNVFATANTKGRGSDDGKFIGANIMNEAFLERFAITLEQEYPPTEIEEKILTNVLSDYGIIDEDFVRNLCKWGDITRQTFANSGASDLISTRRLIHIIKAYSIFKKNKKKALTLGLNRFDNDTKLVFLDLYAKIDAIFAEENVIAPPPQTYIDEEDNNTNDILP